MTGTQAPAHHGATSTRFVADDGAQATYMTLSGPVGDIPLGDVHKGAYRINRAADVPTISLVAQITARPPTRYFRMGAQWLIDPGGGRDLIPSSFDFVGDRLPFGVADDESEDGYVWEQIDVYRIVTHPEATHWTPTLYLYSDPVADAPLPGGQEVFVDCVYVPESGLSVADEPYLDGDQEFGIWEGAPRRSPSRLDALYFADLSVSPESIVVP